MRRFARVLVICGLFFYSCSPRLSNRERLISGAETVAAGPDFAHRQGATGSSKGDHFLYEGSFIVPFEEYRHTGAQILEKDMFCWNVFQKYGDFMRKNIDLKSIPETIARGGSSQYDRNSTRYDFAFEARDVTVIYDTEWFRGGPGQVDQANPEVQVRYHIRIN